jgi:nucleotide-binding universal stress UspA family protein
MKNIVLIDFTEESIDALRYAVDFTKAIDGTLEILNVTDNDKSLEDGQRLMDLKKQYSSANFEIKVSELIGNN